MGRVNEKETAIVETDKVILSQVSIENETAIMLMQLKDEEANLIHEKQDLESLKEKLSLKAKEELEKKKSNVKKLKAEITDLQATCCKLTNSLKDGEEEQLPERGS